MEHNYPIKVICRCCHHLYTINVNPRDYHNWAFGRTLTQVAFPYLSVGERELLISETCNDCWNKMFGEEEDE